MNPPKKKSPCNRWNGQGLETDWITLRILSGLCAPFHGGAKSDRTGRFPGFRVILLAAPSQSKSVAFMRLSSPVTVAGQRWILTIFPFNRELSIPGTESIFTDSCMLIFIRPGEGKSKGKFRLNGSESMEAKI